METVSQCNKDHDENWYKRQSWHKGDCARQRGGTSTVADNGRHLSQTHKKEEEFSI